MLGEAHGKPATLPLREISSRPDGLQLNDVQGRMCQFKFGLEPVIELVTGLRAALEIDFKRAGAYLSLRWAVDHHESPRHQRRECSASGGKSKSGMRPSLV